MFSRRTAWDVRPNALAQAVARRRADGLAILDLTETNPTRVGLTWDESQLARALGRPGIARHDPHPRGLPAARAAVAEWYAGRGVSVSVDDIFLTASTSDAYSALFRLLCDPGDAVMVPRPSYPLLDHLTRLDGVTAVPYRLRLDDRWTVDVDGLDARIPERGRAVVAVHPNNPTGSFLTTAEIRALSDLCRDRGLALISDEVFADFATPDHDGPITVLSPPGGSGGLTFALGGLSKACGLPQVKLAWLVLGGEDDLRADARARLDVIADAYLSASAPAQHALPQLLDEAESFQAPARARLTTNREALDAAIDGSPCRRLPADGGWHAMIALPDDCDADRLAMDLVSDDGGLVQPGWLYDIETPPVVVVSLLPTPETFAAGIDRLLARLDR